MSDTRNSDISKNILIQEPISVATYTDNQGTGTVSLETYVSETITLSETAVYEIVFNTTTSAPPGATYVSSMNLVINTIVTPFAIILSKPTSWSQVGQGVYGSLAGSIPDTAYIVTILGPAVIDVLNNVYVDTPSGILSLSSSVVISKYNTDTAIVSDIATSNNTKSLTDSSTLSDSNLLNTIKIAEDSSSISDNTSLANTKPLADSSTISDISELSNTKPLTDSGTITDTFNRIVDFIRDISDSINVTDDIDGAASLEDEQIALFFKNTTDLASFTDSIIILLSTIKDIFDSINVLDLASLDTIKPLSDLTNITDNVGLGNNKGATDSSTLADTGRIFLITYADASYFSEEYAGDLRTF